MHTKILATIVLLATLSIPRAADAVLLDFEYTFGDGTTVTGSLEGEVQLDGDTVLITGAYGAEYEGETLDMSDYYVGYFSDVANTPPIPIPAGIPGEGLLSFSGDTMDFFACDLMFCDTGVIFTNTPANLPPLTAFTNRDTLTAAIYFEYIQDNWSLTIADTAIPEPNTMLLLGIGLVGLLLGTRRPRNTRALSV